MSVLQPAEITTGTVADGEPRLPMTYAEYLAWDTDNQIVEWADGEAIVHIPPRNEHQSIVKFIYELLAQFVRLFDLGTVQIAPFEIRLTPEGPSREPDVFFLARAHRDRLSSQRLQGPPDLIVEVISPDSVARDRDHKFREYEAAGVPEYWIIDSRPGYRRADFYRLDATGRYQLFATEDQRIVRSTVLPDFWLRPAWLWQEELPDPLLALASIVGTETLIAHLRRAEAEGELDSNTPDR